jgi:hypothetical protein
MLTIRIKIACITFLNKKFHAHVQKKDICYEIVRVALIDLCYACATLHILECNLGYLCGCVRVYAFGCSIRMCVSGGMLGCMCQTGRKDRQ